RTHSRLANNSPPPLHGAGVVPPIAWLGRIVGAGLIGAATVGAGLAGARLLVDRSVGASLVRRLRPGPPAAVEQAPDLAHDTRHGVREDAGLAFDDGAQHATIVPRSRG